MNNGVISRGIFIPPINVGNNIINNITDAVLDTVKTVNQDGSVTYDINDKDVIGVTQSVISESLNRYVTVDEIAADIEKKFGPDASIVLISPIYSRNRFSIILKGIARAAKKLIFCMPMVDEVGNPCGINSFTGVNIMEYYKVICEMENCECVMNDKEWRNRKYPILDCRLHNKQIPKPTKMIYWHLDEICSDVSPDWGLLGSNRDSSERIRLFPGVETSNKICKIIKKTIKKRTGKDVIVCVYGDGCLKDTTYGVWQFADPVTMPGYTDKELLETVSYGTTPILHKDLLASLMNLTSRNETPIVLIQNYFKD